VVHLGLHHAVKPVGVVGHFAIKIIVLVAEILIGIFMKAAQIRKERHQSAVIAQVCRLGVEIAKVAVGAGVAGGMAIVTDAVCVLVPGECSLAILAEFRVEVGGP